MIVYAALHGMEAFMDIAYPVVRDGIIRPAGYVIGFIALLGLYPKLTDQSPKLAGAGAVLATLGAVGWFMTGMATLADHSGIEPPAWFGVFGLLIALGFVLGFPSFGTASLRSEVHSRTVGLLLMGPLLVVIMNVGIVVGGYTSPEGRFVVSSGFALAHLVVGVALGTETVPTHQEESAPDATAR